MASIRREISIDAPAERVWAALRDVGALVRTVPGFVTDAQLDGDERVVTFGNGLVVRERILGVDDEHRRVAWSTASERLTHYNASNQVSADGPDRSRVVWIADLLPNEMEPAVTAMIEQGLAAMKRTLESS